MNRKIEISTMGPYTFFEVVNRNRPGEILYGFTIAGKPENHELYATLDHAMVSAVGERHTGQCGARGTAVGTAADWFMKMIGVGQIKEAGSKGTRVLADVLHDIAVDTNSTLTACGIERRLGERGITLTRSVVTD